MQAAQILPTIHSFSMLNVNVGANPTPTPIPIPGSWLGWGVAADLR